MATYIDEYWQSIKCIVLSRYDLHQLHRKIWFTSITSFKLDTHTVKNRVTLKVMLYCLPITSTVETMANWKISNYSFRWLRVLPTGHVKTLECLCGFVLLPSCGRGPFIWAESNVFPSREVPRICNLALFSPADCIRNAGCSITGSEGSLLCNSCRGEAITLVIFSEASSF